MAHIISSKRRTSWWPRPVDSGGLGGLVEPHIFLGAKMIEDANLVKKNGLIGFSFGELGSWCVGSTGGWG